MELSLFPAPDLGQFNLGWPSLCMAGGDRTLRYLLLVNHIVKIPRRQKGPDRDGRDGNGTLEVGAGWRLAAHAGAQCPLEGPSNDLWSRSPPLSTECQALDTIYRNQHCWLHYVYSLEDLLNRGTQHHPVTFPCENINHFYSHTEILLFGGISVLQL